MGGGCAVGYPRGPGEALGTLGQWDDAWDDVAVGSEGAAGGKRAADLRSRRKIDKVRMLLAEQEAERAGGGGGRLGDEEVVRMLEGMSRASSAHGYKKHIEECMSRLEFSDSDVIRQGIGSAPGRGGARRAQRAASMRGAGARNRILANIDDDNDAAASGAL